MPNDLLTQPSISGQSCPSSTFLLEPQLSRSHHTPRHLLRCTARVWVVVGCYLWLAISRVNIPFLRLMLVHSWVLQPSKVCLVWQRLCNKRLLEAQHLWWTSLVGARCAAVCRRKCAPQIWSGTRAAQCVWRYHFFPGFRYGATVACSELAKVGFAK